MNFPTEQQIENASRYQICKWHRFLNAKTEEQVDISNIIHKRYIELGGFTPEISKSIGWSNV